MIVQIGFSDVVRICNEDEEINFIGLAVTLQQANAIEAELVKRKILGKNTRGLILIVPHYKTGKLLSKDNFFDLDKEISVYSFNPKKDRQNVYSLLKERWYALKSSFLESIKDDDNRIIYVALPAINYQWLRVIEKSIPKTKVVYIRLDDGGASYINQFIDGWNMIGRDEYSISNFLMLLKLICNVSFAKILIKGLAINNRLIDNRLFNKKYGRFIRNKEIAPYYDVIYKKIGAKINPDIIKRFEGAVVINTQCLKESNITDGKADFLLYKRLVRALLEKNMKVIIKTHPRELDTDKYERLGCDVYTDIQYSQECIIAATKQRPICIVSLFSSTLLNISSIFDIPAISVANVMRNDYIINKTCKSYLDDYIKGYGSVVEFPSSVEEIVCFVCGLRIQE